jgi:hypothetical protein
MTERRESAGIAGLVPPPGRKPRAGADDEARFQSWFRGLPWFQEFVRNFGEEPDPDDPHYDYRAAWRAGIEPERYEYDGGRYHWPSMAPNGVPLKSEGHPTMWMEHFMRETGQDPAALGIQTPEEADAYRNRAMDPKDAARALEQQGRFGDTLLAHITPEEAKLLKRRGGAGTRNPTTGLLEFWSAGSENAAHGEAHGSTAGRDAAYGGGGGFGGGGSQGGWAGMTPAEMTDLVDLAKRDRLAVDALGNKGKNVNAASSVMGGRDPTLGDRVADFFGAGAPGGFGKSRGATALAGLGGFLAGGPFGATLASAAHQAYAGVPAGEIVGSGIGGLIGGPIGSMLGREAAAGLGRSGTGGATGGSNGGGTGGGGSNGEGGGRQMSDSDGGRQGEPAPAAEPAAPEAPAAPALADMQMSPFLGDLTRYGFGPEHLWWHPIYSPGATP